MKRAPNVACNLSDVGLQLRQKRVNTGRINRDRPHLIYIEWDVFGSADDLHHWQASGMPNSKLVEHVWIVK